MSLDLGRKIAHELTRRDEMAQRRAIKAGRYFNIYALSIELGAVADMESAIAGGMDAERAFTEHFNPTRKNHGIARKVGLALDVDRGYWVRKDESEAQK